MADPSAANNVWYRLTGQELDPKTILGGNVISLDVGRSAGIDSDFFDNQVSENGREHRCQHAFDRATKTVCSLLPSPDQFSSPALVIDLGCGRGALASEVSKSGFTYVGVDASLENLRVAAERHPNLTFIHAMSDDIPFQSKSVAAFVFANFLHHVPDPTQLLKELKPFLKQSGCIAGFEPNFLSPYGFLGWIKNFSVDRRIIQYNRWSLLRRFRRAGLDNVQVRGANLFPCFVEGPRIERFYDFIEKHFLNRLTRGFTVHQIAFGTKS